jgi:hypothetical protein
LAAGESLTFDQAYSAEGRFAARRLLMGDRVTTLSTTSMSFFLRRVPGYVHIEYGPNEDPVHWGYDTLGSRFPPEMARGFPVIQAIVVYEPEGYAAYMGWLQVVRAVQHETGARETMFDVNPQMGDMEMPFIAMGVRPTLFDAPTTTERDVTWEADTFLVHTPDVLSRDLHPICGFSWGYRLSGGEVSLIPLTMARDEDWNRNLPDLRQRYPTWTFGAAWPDTRSDVPS